MAKQSRHQAVTIEDQYVDHKTYNLTRDTQGYVRLMGRGFIWPYGASIDSSTKLLIRRLWLAL